MSETSDAPQRRPHNGRANNWAARGSTAETVILRVFQMNSGIRPGRKSHGGLGRAQPFIGDDAPAHQITGTERMSMLLKFNTPGLKFNTAQRPVLTHRKHVPTMVDTRSAGTPNC